MATQTACLLSLIFLIGAPPARAQLPSFSEFKARLGDAPAPARISGRAVLEQAAYNAGPEAPELPSKFQIIERVIALTNTFDVSGGGASFGTIYEKLISLTRSFTYKAPDGRCLAQAREVLFSWGVEIEVSDCGGTKIGAIKENVLKSFFKVHTTYSILDAGGRAVASSKKVDWLGTEVTLYAGAGGTGMRIAKLSRPWINVFSDRWDVELYEKRTLDPRLIVMIAAYKTSVDNARRSSQ